MNKLLNTFVFAIAGWTFAAPAIAFPVLSIQPTTATTTIGGSTSVNLMISGLTASSQIVSGFDLDVYFNPLVVNAGALSTSTSPWGQLSDVILSQNFVAPGHVAFSLTALKSDAALAALQGDSFVLSTITFLGLTDGFSNVSFGPDPDFERNVVGRDATSLALDVGGSCIAVGSGSCLVGTVPEPGMASLVLLGLLGAGVTTARGRSRWPSQPVTPGR